VIVFALALLFRLLLSVIIGLIAWGILAGGYFLLVQRNLEPTEIIVTLVIGGILGLAAGFKEWLED